MNKKYKMNQIKFHVQLVIFLNIFTFQYCLAGKVENSSNNPKTDEEFLLRGELVRIPKNEIKKVLKDLPPWNAKTKRWYMHADDWGQHADGNYILKGKFLVLEQVNGKSNVRLKLYEKPDKKSKYIFEFQEGVLYQNGKPVCGIWEDPPVKVKVSKYSKCTYAFCEIIKKEQKIVQSFHPDEMETYDGKAFCSYKLKMVSTFAEVNTFNFPELEPASNGFYKVQVDSKFYYLALDELDDCKKKGNCYHREQALSFFEKEWVKFKLYAKNKDLDSLNKLRGSLLPCLEKNDITCIKKFFVTKEEFSNIENRAFLAHGNTVKFRETVIDEKNINELKACLNYDKLLHVGDMFIATRGINKACLIYDLFEVSNPSPAGNVKILSVAYPESLRRDSPYLYLYVPEN